MDTNQDIFKDLCALVGCEFISDLRGHKYNDIAKELFFELDLGKYGMKEIADLTDYLNHRVY